MIDRDFPQFEKAEEVWDDIKETWKETWDDVKDDVKDFLRDKGLGETSDVHGVSLDSGNRTSELRCDEGTSENCWESPDDDYIDIDDDGWEGPWEVPDDAYMNDDGWAGLNN